MKVLLYGLLGGVLGFIFVNVVKYIFIKVFKLDEK